MIRPLHLLVLLAAAGCASAPSAVPASSAPAAPAPQAPAPPAAAAARPSTGLELVIVPADADVEIEGVRRAPASAIASGTGGIVPLAPGVYRVSIRHPEYATWRAEVSVRTGVERIEVTLSEQR